ncbi:biliverdin-producing heme oxygenase [Roseixanthobacter pseudopolyaromaticivorans]|uniref:biliverdin-producing heme oxygenase n=1 Tax=Xanthobacteraceae TaxID=335928 RepID=UPI003729B558
MSVRAMLRNGTAVQHQRLDSCFSALALSEPEGYRLFLSANAAALLPLETRLERAGVAHILPDWPQRARRAALMADLRDLGVSRVDTVEAPEFESADAILGALYVLEGSRLGSAVLLRRAGGLHGAATRFLAHGRHERLWASFLPVLEAVSHDAPTLACLAQAARRTFETFIHAVSLTLPATVPARAFSTHPAQGATP